MLGCCNRSSSASSNTLDDLSLAGQCSDSSRLIAEEILDDLYGMDPGWRTIEILWMWFHSGRN